MTEPTKDEPVPRCRICGKDLTDEPDYADQGLCGDCYWDDQTNADGTVDDDDG